MDWLAHHRQSEAHASQAHAYLREGRIQDSEAAFRLAAEAEEAALALLDESKPRTMGITAVSAVSLWFKGRDFARASRLAHRYLSMPGLYDSARAQLDDLLLTLYNERDKQRMSGEFLPGSVTVAVRGGGVLRGAAPLDLVVEKVKTLQAMFYRVVEMAANKPLRKRGGPSRDVLDSFEPWLVQEAPGSFQFSVAVKVTGQLDLFDRERPDAVDIARNFLEIVTTVANDGTGDATKELIPDPEYRATFRRLVRNLTPASGGFETLTITSKGRDDVAVSIDKSTKPRLTAMLKAEQPTPDEGSGETPTELVGVLRALDLDKDWLKIETPDGTQVEVNKLSQTVDDVIGPMVNKRVMVRAIRTMRSDLRFTDIELAED
ncbi:MAG: hypothetical protein AB1434_14140 [Pseudomonadota bacterium]